MVPLARAGSEALPSLLTASAGHFEIVAASQEPSCRDQLHFNSAVPPRAYLGRPPCHGCIARQRSLASAWEFHFGFDRGFGAQIRLGVAFSTVGETRRCCGRGTLFVGPPHTSHFQRRRGSESGDRRPPPVSGTCRVQNWARLQASATRRRRGFPFSIMSATLNMPLTPSEGSGKPGFLTFLADACQACNAGEGAGNALVIAFQASRR